MEHEIICEEGICFATISPPFSLNKIMICGSLINALYYEMPPISIVLDNEKYADDIILLDNIFLEECQIKLDIISHNSFCLRVYEKNSRGSEDYFIKFKIKQNSLFKIVNHFLEINGKV